MSYFNTMHGTDDVNTQLPVEMIATVNGFSREKQPIIELGKELIRCKDCKNFMRKRPQDDFDSCMVLFEMMDVPLLVTEDSYCSFAERKEE